MKFFDNKAENEELWKVRESRLGTTAHIAREAQNWEGWEDSAMPPGRAGPYLRELKKLFDRYGYVGALFGQRCIHAIQSRFRRRRRSKPVPLVSDEATDLVLKYRGS